MTQSGPQTSSELDKTLGANNLALVFSNLSAQNNTVAAIDSKTAHIKALIKDTTPKGRKALHQLLLQKSDCNESTKEILNYELWLTADGDGFTGEHPALLQPGLFPELRLLMISGIYNLFGFISQQSLDFVKLCLHGKETIPDACAAVVVLLQTQSPNDAKQFLQNIRNNITHSNDPKEREAKLILAKLAKKGGEKVKKSKPTIEQLIPWLQDGYSDVRKTATHAMFAMESYVKGAKQLTIDEILQRFEHWDLDSRINAAETISAIYPLLIPEDAQSTLAQLLTFLESDGWKKPEAAALAIGKISPYLNKEDAQSAFKKLLPLLKHTGFRIPIYTIEAIGAIAQHLSQEDTKLFLSQLLLLLQHEERPVRSAAHKALAIVYPHANEEQKNYIHEKSHARLNNTSFCDAVLYFYSQHWNGVHSSIDFSQLKPKIEIPGLDKLEAQNPNKQQAEPSPKIKP
jgi:hypothetical protein